MFNKGWETCLQTRFKINQYNTFQIFDIYTEFNLICLKYSENIFIIFIDDE